LIFAVRAAVLLFNNFIKIKITTQYSEEVRNRLFGKVIQADWPHLLKQKLGHLDTLLMTNVSYAESLLHALSGTIMLVTGLTMYLIVAVNISWQITLFTMILGAVIFFLLLPLRTRTRKVAAAAEIVNRDMAHFINEHVVGMKTVKVMQADGPVISKGRGIFGTMKNLRFKIFLLGVLPDSLVQPIGLMFVLVLFAYSYRAPNFNIAAFAAVVYLIDKMFVYLQQLQSQLQKISELVPYLKAVLQYEDDAVLSHEHNKGTQQFGPYKSIEFKDVGFSYDKENIVLKGLSFKVERGEFVGIVGPSGVGKTTIVDMLLRLFEPTEGSIKIDDQDLSAIDLRSWRSQIGYISQDIFLLNDTIANNIRFYDNTITDDKIKKAAEQAELLELVESLPEKFETMVGERGIRLSAGQRQRIVIARILAREPKILILDEATSALDNETEKEILDVVLKLKGKTTTFIIAHRLTTVTATDQILVLGGGAVVESGSPAELLRDMSSQFYKLYTLQT
jgi:ATP-binding cassette subfamily B protein/subfamily B ATP-binding cassette protein MsbA